VERGNVGNSGAKNDKSLFINNLRCQLSEAVRRLELSLGLFCSSALASPGLIKARGGGRILDILTLEERRLVAAVRARMNGTVSNEGHGVNIYLLN
jgi:hypothetical protein